MICIPTFHFNKGYCAEAISLYQKAFNLIIDWQGKDEKGHIYHTEARIGNQRIRLSDGGFERDTMETESLFIAVVFDTVEEVEKVFDILKEGGTVGIMPHKPDFATCWSVLKDKFGVKWSLMVD